MRARVAGDERLERQRDRFGERPRQTERQRAAQRVAVLGRVVGGDEPHLAGDRHLDDPTLVHQRRQPLGRRVALAAQVDLGSGEIADLAEHVVQLVGDRGPDGPR